MTGRTLRLIVGILASAILAVSCSSGPDSSNSPPEPVRLVLVTHDSFALSDGILDAFTAESGIEVELQTTWDAGVLVNQLILTKDNPLGDVAYGFDSTFLSRVIEADIFVPHVAAAILSVDPALRIDGDLATPIDTGYVCVNYDIAAFAALGVDPPLALSDLTSPTYRDMLVVQDPATSSPGLAFLFATVAAFPEGSSYDWHEYWVDLLGNGTHIAPDWSSAYLTDFSRSGGAYPLVVSYSTSPVAEVFYSDLAEAPTGIMLDSCSRQVEYAAVIRGRQHEGEAALLVDYLLSNTVQEDIPLNMFVFPVNSQASVPPLFTEYAVEPDNPRRIPRSDVDANRERWIAEWTAIARS